LTARELNQSNILTARGKAGAWTPQGVKNAIVTGSMTKITIDRFRIVPGTLTGIDWVAVQEWDVNAGEYRHAATFRSRGEANSFILAQ